MYVIDFYDVIQDTALFLHIRANMTKNRTAILQERFILFTNMSTVSKDLWTVNTKQLI